MKYLHALYGFLFAAACFCLNDIAFAAQERFDPSTGKKDATQLIKELMSLTQQGVNNQQQEKRYEETEQKIISCGKEAIPAIKENLSSTNELAKVHLVRILSLIPGNETTQILVQLACEESDTKIANEALSSIGNRPIDLSLSTAQIDFLTRKIDKANSIHAASAANILSKSKMDDKGALTAPIVTRFRREIEGASNDMAQVPGSYVSPRVFRLNQYLRVFPNLGTNGIGQLKLLVDNEKNDDVKKWLILALGMCGDSTVAEAIRDIVQNDSDPYIQCVSIPAYARSAKEAAIPVLEPLLKDNFKSEYDKLPGGKPVYPIRSMAKQALKRLKGNKGAQGNSVSNTQSSATNDSEIGDESRQATIGTNGIGSEQSAVTNKTIEK